VTGRFALMVRILLGARVALFALSGCTADLTVAEPREGGGRSQQGEVPRFGEEDSATEPQRVDAEGPIVSDPVDASEAGDDADAGENDADAADGDAADGA